MNGKEFGNLVRTLRKSRTFYDANGFPKPWTRQKLAEEAGLGKRQIDRIEQGKMKKLEPFLSDLAQAFALTETEKMHFYATAGHVYQTEQPQVNEEMLKAILANIPYPASVRTPLWDFVAVNEYHRQVRGLTPTVIEMMNEGDIGPNLLWVLFDQRFDPHNTTIHQDNWRAEAILAFRASAFRYVRTKRYRYLVSKLKEIPSFGRAWHLATQIADFSSNAYRHQPISGIKHEDFGIMRFLSLRVPQRYLGDLEIAVYVPLEDSEERYQAFRASVARRPPTFFEQRPLN